MNNLNYSTKQEYLIKITANTSKQPPIMTMCIWIQFVLHLLQPCNICNIVYMLYVEYTLHPRMSVVCLPLILFLCSFYFPFSTVSTSLATPTETKNTKHSTFSTCSRTPSLSLPPFSLSRTSSYLGDEDNSDNDNK